MTTDRHRRRSLVPALAPVLAVGVLIALAATACSADGPDDRLATGADEGATTSASPADGSTTTADRSDTGGSSSTGDGRLSLGVGRRGVTLTVTAGSKALVVLADLSLARVDADGSSWHVTIARPDGPRSSTADLPDAFGGVLARPGEAVEVGVYELGPRPPTELTLCLEVAPATAAQAGGATGAEELLPAGTGSPTTLCATAAIR